jgi:hypothetical protein
MSTLAHHNQLPKSSRRRPQPTKAPEWLQQCELSFIRSGKLRITTVDRPDLTAIKSRASLKELNLSKTKLTSIEGLAAQRNISAFIADDSALESFANFSAISNASTYSLKNTPLSEDPLFRLSIALLSAAPSVVVNGSLISEAERKKAALYPPFTVELLNAGWKLVWPCPAPKEMCELCRQHNVTYLEDCLGFVRPSASDLQSFPWVALGQKDAKAPVNSAEEAFRAEALRLLAKGTSWTFKDDENLDEQLVAAVTSLCLHRKRNKLQDV